MELPPATPPAADHRVLRGYPLRAWLVVTLHGSGSALRVRDLVVALRRDGFTTQGRASKDLSDALRWEVSRGRVRRVARATYVAGHTPRTTLWRMRRRLRAAHGGSEAPEAGDAHDAA